MPQREEFQCRSSSLANFTCGPLSLHPCRLIIRPGLIPLPCKSSTTSGEQFECLYQLFQRAPLMCVSSTHIKSVHSSPQRRLHRSVTMRKGLHSPLGQSSLRYTHPLFPYGF